MKILVTLLLGVFLVGCATQRYNINSTTVSQGATPSKEMMQPFFVSGIGQVQEMNAAAICGGVEKIAYVESHQSFLNIVLGTLTTGIYTPRQAKVYCMR